MNIKLKAFLISIVTVPIGLLIMVSWHETGYGLPLTFLAATIGMVYYFLVEHFEGN
jgi:hypothetical protein